MRDFEEVSRENVLTEMVNDSDIFAFVLKIDSRKTVTYMGYRLRNEKLGVIQGLISQANVVFYKKTEEVKA